MENTSFCNENVISSTNIFEDEPTLDESSENLKFHKINLSSIKYINTSALEITKKRKKSKIQNENEKQMV